MTKSVNEREIVLEILMEVTENGQYSHIVLRDVLSKYQYLEKRERAFITRVTEGTLEHLIEIDYISGSVLKSKSKEDEARDPQSAAQRGVSAEIHGQHPGPRGVQRVGKAGGEKRVFRAERVCKRSAAKCCQRT